MQRVWSMYLDSNGQQINRAEAPSPQSMDHNSTLPNTGYDDHTHSRSSSINSHQSNAASTRYMLAGMNNNSQTGLGLEPPNLPFGNSGASSFRSLSPKNDFPLISSDGGRTNSVAASLSVNYLPTKFSDRVLSGGPKRRKNWKQIDGMIPKRGGGREAFKSNEARMPGAGDDDYDAGRAGGHTRPKPRWTRFKFILAFANFVFTLYAFTGFIATILIWLNVWTHADIIRVGNNQELIITTVAAALAVFVSLIGWSGIVLNNRAFLAWYTFLLWIVFALLVTPGYITYKKREFNLQGKLNSQWSRDLGLDGRLRVQNQLQCCGYFSPFVEATVSQTCYARSVLPGCKGPYLNFERTILKRWYICVFALVPAQLGVMIIALLCSNHVTYRFGKGMMPKAYRLNMNSMAVIMDNYANQLAEQYGNDVASEILARSRSNLQLDAMPTMPYNNGTQHSYSSSGKYDSLTNKGPE